MHLAHVSGGKRPGPNSHAFEIETDGSVDVETMGRFILKVFGIRGRLALVWIEQEREDAFDAYGGGAVSPSLFSWQSLPTVSLSRQPSCSSGQN